MNLDVVDLSCTFAPVVGFTMIRRMLSIAVQAQWEVHQTDSSSAMLQNALDREVCMMVHEHINYILKKSLSTAHNTVWNAGVTTHMVDLLSRNFIENGVRP